MLHQPHVCGSVRSVVECNHLVASSAPRVGSVRSVVECAHLVSWQLNQGSFVLRCLLLLSYVEFVYCLYV